MVAPTSRSAVLWVSRPTGSVWRRGCRQYSRSGDRRYIPSDKFLLVVGQLVGLLQVEAGLVDGALGVVVGLDGQAVLVDRAVALAGDVEDLAQGDVAPDLGPARVAVAAQGVAVGS